MTVYKTTSRLVAILTMLLASSTAPAQTPLLPNATAEAPADERAWPDPNARPLAAPASSDASTSLRGESLAENTTSSRKSGPLTTAATSKKGLLDFAGHEMSIEAEHLLRATAWACTWSVMSNPDEDRCPNFIDEAYWADHARVTMSKVGGEIVLDPATLSVATAAAQTREKCGSARAAAQARAEVSHVALATGAGAVAFTMIQGKHGSSAWDSDGFDISSDCLTAAGSSTAHNPPPKDGSFYRVLTQIPFTVTRPALVTAVIEHSELVGAGGAWEHDLFLDVEIAGTFCTVKTDGTGLPQICRIVLELEPGTYGLSTIAYVEAETTAGSNDVPDSGLSYLDYVSATIAARPL